MPSKINPHYKPSARVYEVLQTYGAPAEFVDFILPQFVTYWLDLAAKDLKKAKKTSWDATCLNWMRRSWRGKAGREWEDNRHKNQGFRPRFKNDLFEEVLGGMIAESESLPTPPKRRRVYHKPIQPPPPTETMSESEGLEKLREFLGK